MPMEPPPGDVHEGTLLGGTVRSSVVERLSRAGCVAADEEATELLSAAPDPATLEAWIGRRERGEPLAWVTGSQWFCGHRIGVDPGVYVPRPQSEELARRAAAVLLGHGGPALDLCTGSGAIACHLMARAPSVTVVAADVDRRAVICARSNGARVVQSDLAGPFGDGVFGVVTAIAPYVPTAALAVLPSDVRDYEPRLALDGGPDGLEVARRIAASARRVLRPGGWLLLELGGDQGPPMVATLTNSGWREVSTWADEDGDLRGLSARSPPS
jgi:release factor glutamine methyltransferase